MSNDIYLNPLLNIDRIFSKHVRVEIVSEKSIVLINREIFSHLIKIMDKNCDIEKISGYLSKVFCKNVDEVKKFLGSLMEHKIIIKTLSDFPTEQIGMWKHYKWTNALIYHLKSQNIECVDDKNESNVDGRVFPKDNLKTNQVWKLIATKIKINLPPGNVEAIKNECFEKIIINRNSASPLNSNQVDLEALATLLQVSNRDLVKFRNNLLDNIKNFYDTRFVALETYVVVHRVQGIGLGVYHYDPKGHALCLVGPGNFKNKVSEICIGQRKSSSGAFTLFITACIKRYMIRYKHERAYRNLLINVSELAHQYIFYATAIGLNTWLTPAIIENKAAELLNVDNEMEIPIYTVSVG